MSTSPTKDSKPNSKTEEKIAYEESEDGGVFELENSVTAISFTICIILRKRRS